jgi:hypothetical protein
MDEQENSKEYFWSVYDKLPDDLKEAVFSEETSENITKICLENNIAEELSSEVYKYAGKVLMGLLSPKEFSVTMELELNLDAEQARNLAAEIDRKVFSHLRISLNKLYSPSVAENKEVSDNTKKEGAPETKEVVKPKVFVNPKDPYKEPLI